MLHREDCIMRQNGTVLRDILTNNLTKMSKYEQKVAAEMHSEPSLLSKKMLKYLAKNNT